ncbi:hypothetical protein [Sediminibacterium sp.]|uniref:hypothetical protein n=1 Tax=Sediminibacterium sp. TaxID=1917865 RepID=UPI00273750D0|nr:hypothetical protein [Sediminibacterium sp.]MDP3393920.1 hypothetical protein [Sediminibacterium sp.]MDP3568749.1 hypothetical protein [Sediminibacterium sp.]
MSFKLLYTSIFLCFILSAEAQLNLPVALYAQHNQSIFNIKERIYSKIYVRSSKGLHMQPLNIYVDWYTAEGTLLVHQIYLTKFGGAEASFEIPVDYPFAFLRMRMYTLENLKLLPNYQFSDQIIFVNQKSNFSQKQIPESINSNSVKLQSDEAITVKKVFSSFSTKGRNEWLIENKGKDFMNLSLSITEEESFEPPMYNILQHFKSPNLTSQHPKSDYYDAFVQVRGQLKLADLNSENANLVFSLFKRGQMPIIDQVPLASDGSFSIDRLIFTDSAQLSLQLDYRGKRNQKIELSYQQLGLFKTAPLYAFNFLDSLPVFYPRVKQASWTNYQKQDENEVVVYAKSKSALELLEDKYATGLFKGGDAIDFNMMLPNVRSFPTLFHFLQGKVPGLQIFFQSATSTQAIDSAVTAGRKEEESGIFGTPKFSWRSNQDQIKFFLNQVPVSVDALLQLPMADIAYIKVFRPPFLGAGMGAPNGAIAVYTKQGDEADYVPKKSKLTRFMLQGYTNPFPYLSPDYSSEKKRAVIDKRKTLLWVPTIHLNHDSPDQRIIYYNNDRSKKHRIIIEGVKQNGDLIRKEWIVE